MPIDFGFAHTYSISTGKYFFVVLAIHEKFDLDNEFSFDKPMLPPCFVFIFNTTILGKFLD